MKPSEEHDPPPDLPFPKPSGYSTPVTPLEAFETLTEDELKRFLGTAYFGSNAALLLHMRSTPRIITLVPASQTFLGRFETPAPDGLSIDLAPYDAATHGVSRRHAVLLRGEVTLIIQDLDSTNGTYLNTQRLFPHQGYVLHDGDEIRLGTLPIQIAFQYR